MRTLFKLSTILVILLLLSTGIPVGLSNNTDKINGTYQEDDVLTNNAICEALESITIDDLISYIKHYIEDSKLDSNYKELISTSINNGLDEMDHLGIRKDYSLLKAKGILSSGVGILDRGNVKHRWFMIGFFPVIVTMSTIIPRVSFNITEVPSPIGNLTVKLELFIKAVPFIDFVTIREPRLILPGLTQTTRIWPAVGARITIQGVTLFIMAYGPRIKWIREDILKR